MILDPSHFDTKIYNINQILWNNESKITSLNRMLNKRFDKKEISHYYDLIFKNFPLDIENASQEISVSIFATEIFELHHLVELNIPIPFDLKNELLEKRKSFNPELNSIIIEDFISTYVHHLVYFYEDFLKNTFNQHYFIGINDEIKILLSILKRYKNVRNDKTKQIDLFWGIKLNKQLSDLVLEIIIEFIEQRLNLLTVSTENINTGKEWNYVENNIFGLTWNGTQQNLCELILELEKKQWITEIKNGERKKISNSVTKIFRLSETKRNQKSNSENSFYQLMKGEIEDNRRIHPFMERNNYQKKFSNIIENK